MDKVKKFGIANVSGPAQASSACDSPILCGAQGPVQGFVPGSLIQEGLPLSYPTATSAIGGIQLNSGIRRNRSFPAMVGSSMQMKAPSTLTTGILMGAKLPKQTSLR